VRAAAGRAIECFDLDDPDLAALLGRPAQLQAVLDKLRWLAGARAEKL